MNKMLIKNILKLSGENQKMSVEGWIRTKRDSKGIIFLEINDGSTIKNLQVVVENTFNGFDSIKTKLNNGASVKIDGVLIDSPGEGQTVELKADFIHIFGDAPIDDYPMQKKRHTFEYLREIAHLRTRTNTFGAVARVRNALSYAIHKFFQESDFLYIHTPIISGNDCEGAGEMFQITTIDISNPPVIDNAVDYTKDFFGKKAFLTVSGQLEGEAFATAFKNIYTFGPTFRAENSNTSRHLAEFWMIEPEMAFCDISLNMDVAEEFIKYIIKYVLEQCPDDMDFFNKRIEKGVINKLENIVNKKFERITYTEAIDLLLDTKEKFEFPVKWGIDLQSEHEKYLTEKIFEKPVIVIDYPVEIKAFYMKLNDDKKTVRAMDVLVPRLGEIIGGSERETDYKILKQRIQSIGFDPDEYWWYLDLRKFGSVPHSGFGLGFERLMQFVTGMQNIRDVIPFPRTVKNLEF